PNPGAVTMFDARLRNSHSRGRWVLPLVQPVAVLGLLLLSSPAPAVSPPAAPAPTTVPPAAPVAGAAPAPAAGPGLSPASGEWPAFHGGGGLRGEAKPLPPGDLTLRWTYKAGDDTDTASIEGSAAIAGGVAYVGDGRGVLHAIDLAT